MVWWYFLDDKDNCLGIIVVLDGSVFKDKIVIVEI
jgi:hypothetical protein